MFFSEITVSFEREKGVVTIYIQNSKCRKPILIFDTHVSSVNNVYEIVLFRILFSCINRQRKRKLHLKGLNQRDLFLS